MPKKLVHILFLLSLLPAMASAGGHRALFISSYHPGFPTFFQQLEGLRAEFGPAGVALDIEFMDTKRIAGAENQLRFFESMRFKSSRLEPYDVIVVADDAALRFALEHGESLFGKKPVVFCGINNQELARSLSGSPSFTGVIESVSMRETLEDIWRLRPDTRAVYALVDAEPGGQGDLRTYLSLAGVFAGRRLEVIPLDALTWVELGDRLAGLPRDAAVLLLSAYRDKNGVTKTFDESLGLVLDRAAVPVFHLWEHGMGRGILGGKIISHEEQGRIAGRMALRILRGEPVSSIPVVEGNEANRHVFDHAALRRFGVDEALLPPDSDVRGKPVSIFSQYRAEILLACGFMLILSCLVLVLSRHVIHLRRARAKIMESETRYKALFDANADGVLVANGRTRRFMFANPAACRMFGYPAEDLCSLGVDDIHPSDQLDLVHGIFDAQARGEKDIAEAIACRRRDGGVFLADIRSFNLDIDGKPCTVGLFRDVTERSQMLDVLRQSKEAAEAASRTKSEFLANMSHEIRTPLNGIAGMLQLLQGSDPTPEQREYLDLALTSSMRLTRLLTDILDLSRIEADMLILETKPFGMSDVRESILGLFATAAQEKGLALEFGFDDGFPPVLVGDQARLHQILFNLVGNAIKFTEQGRVSVYASLQGPSDGRRCRALFCVSDTGIGISDDLLERIFQPFVQAEGSYVRRFQGAGLGLSIVRRLTHLMGGSLSVDNSRHGTTFYVSMPFGLPGPETHRAGTAPTAADSVLGRKRVLLAEDDETNMLAVRGMLERLGHEVVTAGNGLEAVSRLRDEEFDVVVMDIQMPVLDGVEATRRIREDVSLGRRRFIPILAMTAYAMIGDRETFLAAGMNDYISKPVDMAALSAGLERVAPLRHPLSGGGEE